MEKKRQERRGEEARRRGEEEEEEGMWEVTLRHSSVTHSMEGRLSPSTLEDDPLRDIVMLITPAINLHLASRPHHLHNVANWGLRVERVLCL